MTWIKIRPGLAVGTFARANDGEGNVTPGRAKFEPVLNESGRAKCSELALRGQLSRSAVGDRRRPELAQGWYDREIGPENAQRFLDLMFPRQSWCCRRCKNRSEFVPIRDCGDAGDGGCQGARQA